MSYALQIYSGPPVERDHRCNDFCEETCFECSNYFCRDDEGKTSKRVGDSMDYVHVCPECSEREAA